jgi:hypothetical protein
MLTAATMAATGLGGMQLASGLAEQKADEEAETAMRAYLATFTCEYGDKRFAGGESAIELPGANILTPLVMEYKALAADLKARKAALGMQPGIESEEIIDVATAGLYDDENVGKTGGAYTSLSRALSGDETAAAEWNAQREESAQKIKTGATVGGVKYGASAFNRFRSAKDVAKISTKGIKTAAKAGKQVNSLWGKMVKNSKEYSAAIVNWAKSTATGKVATKVVNSKAFQKVSAGIGAIGAAFVFISGIGEMGNAISKMANNN